MISHPVSVTSHPLYLWHNTTKYDITALCVDDATLGICMTSFALQMTMHPLYHTKPQYLWCHIHLRYDTTAPVLDIAPTVSVSSNRLHWHLTHFCMTSHSLLCDTIWTIYNINPILMSSHYCTYDITASIYENISSMWATYTLNMWHHSHYLCHHTHSIDYITPTLFMTPHSP